MNQKKDISNQENSSLTRIRQVEYKQTGQRYNDMRNIQQFDEKEQDPHLKELVKQDIEGSLMKFDEESHANLSDSEKETQITQSTNHVDHQDRLNMQQQEISQNIKGKNPSARYQAFDKALNNISEYHSRQMPPVVERQFKQLYQNENQPDSKSSNTQPRKNINIFSDQRKMNQQILNETLEKKSQNSLTEIHSFKQKESLITEQKTTKSIGTFSHIEEQQTDSIINKQPKSYNDYYKQIQLQHNVQHNEKKKQQTSPSAFQDNHSGGQQESTKQNPFYSFYQKSPNQESIPFSNASTFQSVHNNSDLYQNSNHNSLTSTPQSKSSPQQKEIYPYINQSNNNSKSSSFEGQKPAFSHIKYRGSGLFQSRKSNNLDLNNSTNSNYLSVGSINQLTRTASDIQRPSEKKRSLIEVQEQLNAAIAASEQNIKLNEEAIQINNQSDEEHHDDINENVICKDKNILEKTQQTKTEQDDDEEDRILIIPAEQSIIEEQITINQDDQRKEPKKDHLLSEAYLFKNGENKNPSIIISNEALSPSQNKQNQDQQNANTINNSNTLQVRKPFLGNLRKRVQRSNKNILDSNENDGSQNKSNDQSEVKLICISQDSLQENQNQGNDIKQNNESDVNLQTEETPQKLKNHFSDILNSNFNKINFEIKRDLSGSKQQQFEQVEKKIVNDQTINDNSFSDDSPLPFVQNSNTQLGGNLHLFKHKLQGKSVQNKSQQKTTLQQFQTQIMSESNESDSDISSSNLQKKNEIQQQKIQIEDNENIRNNLIKIRNCSIDGNTDDIYQKTIKSLSKTQNCQQIQQDSLLPLSENDTNTIENNQIRYQKENNLIIFSNQQIDGSDQPVQSTQQIDDFNNFSIPQSLLLSACKELDELSSPQKSNRSNDEENKNNSNIESLQQFDKNRKPSPLERAQIGNQTKTNIIHFETEEDLDNIDTPQDQNNNEQSPEQKDQYDDEQINEVDQHEIVTEFQVEFSHKTRRVHRFKAFSQNNTPIHNQKASDKSDNYQYRNSAEQTLKKFKSRPSTFQKNLQQYREQQGEKSSSDDNQMKENTPNNEQVCIQEVGIPIFLIPPAESEKEENVIEFFDTVENNVTNVIIYHQLLVDLFY